MKQLILIIASVFTLSVGTAYATEVIVLHETPTQAQKDKAEKDLKERLERKYKLADEQIAFERAKKLLEAQQQVNGEQLRLQAGPPVPAPVDDTYVYGSLNGGYFPTQEVNNPKTPSYSIPGGFSHTSIVNNNTNTTTGTNTATTGTTTATASSNSTSSTKSTSIVTGGTGGNGGNSSGHVNYSGGRDGTNPGGHGNANGVNNPGKGHK